MATENNGNQSIINYFHFPLNTPVMNQKLRDILPFGVYNGMYLSIIDDGRVEVDTGSIIIYDNDNDLVAVKVDFNDTFIVYVNPTTPFVILRYTWKTSENWFVDPLAVSNSDLLNTDIILGECVYSGSNLVDIDYHLRTNGLFYKTDFLQYRLSTYNNLSNYLSNQSRGNIYIIENPQDDPNRFLTSSLYIVYNNTGSNIEDIYTNTFEINIGMTVYWAGTVSNIPQNYHICDGSELSRTDYAELFDAIGTIHGSGDGSTTFNIPNAIDRFIRSENTSGNSGGSDDAIVVDHTHTMQSAGDHIHTVDNSGSGHSHNVSTAGSHHHTYESTYNHTTYAGVYSDNVIYNNSWHSVNTSNNGVHTHSASGGSHTHTLQTAGNHTHIVDNEGVSGTGMNMPAYYSLIMLIKVK